MSVGQDCFLLHTSVDGTQERGFVEALESEKDTQPTNLFAFQKKAMLKESSQDDRVCIRTFEISGSIG